MHDATLRTTGWRYPIHSSLVTNFEKLLIFRLIDIYDLSTDQRYMLKPGETTALAVSPEKPVFLA